MKHKCAGVIGETARVIGYFDDFCDQDQEWYSLCYPGGICASDEASRSRVIEELNIKYISCDNGEGEGDKPHKVTIDKKSYVDSPILTHTYEGVLILDSTGNIAYVDSASFSPDSIRRNGWTVLDTAEVTLEYSQTCDNNLVESMVDFCENEIVFHEILDDIVRWK